MFTSKNIGSILAIKTTNFIEKYEVTEQVLESTTSKSQKEEHLTLLKVEKKLKKEPSEDLVEYEFTYFEAKDDKLLRSTSVTLSLGQMVVTQMLCKKFLSENIHGWNIMARK